MESAKSPRTIMFPVKDPRHLNHLWATTRININQFIDPINNNPHKCINNVCMANRRRRNASAPTHDNNPPPPPTATGPHPVYHGIRCRAGKWVSEIREPNKSTRIWLGTYPTPEMAAAAYDVAALALKGPYAVLNFPDSILSNTLPEGPTPDDIRAAAAVAAAARHPGNESRGGSSTTAGSTSTREFMNDEEVFDMPNMLSDMAEGMLLTPPRMNPTPPDDGDNSGGGNLWDY